MNKVRISTKREKHKKVPNRNRRAEGHIRTKLKNREDLKSCQYQEEETISRRFDFKCCKLVRHNEKFTISEIKRPKF